MAQRRGRAAGWRALGALLLAGCASAGGARPTASPPPGEDAGARAPSPPLAEDAPPADPLDDPPARVAFHVLRRARGFAGAAVGTTGEPSRQVVALRVLVSRPGARQLLRRLLEEADLAGRLYALCGLYRLDRAAFAEGVAELRDSEALVPTLFGCLVGSAPAGELVEARAGRALRLEEGQTLREWRRERSRAAVVFDIAGGGYPSLFLGEDVWEAAPAAPPERWVRDLAQDAGADPLEAVDALVAVGARAVPAAVEGLRRGAPPVRWLMAEALGRIGPAAWSAAPALAAALDDPHPRVRREAGRALAALGPWGVRDGAPGLWDALAREADPEVSLELAGTLEELVPDYAVAGLPAEGAPEWVRVTDEGGDELACSLVAVPDEVREGWVDALGHVSDTFLAEALARALVRWSEDPAAAAEDLVRGLENPRPEVRAAATAWLEHLGPAAGPASAAPLRRALDDEDPGVRTGAAAALEALGLPPSGAGEAFSR